MCQQRRDLSGTETVIIDAARRRHILDGDGVNGGHRPGTGIPGKTEFPRGWPDDRIIREIGGQTIRSFA
jgi:hypothetical protein